MDVIQQEVFVSFRYPVHFTTGAFDPLNPLLATLVSGRPGKVLFVVDDGVAAAHIGLAERIGEYCRAHGDALSPAGPVLIVPGGERIKNDPWPLEEIRRAIHDARLCRHSYVVAVGGGCVLDVVGYAAATAHRGVRLVRMPTTVLAQDDSAVGVKNGINAFGKKNYLGTFAPPAAVINDFDFLMTLSDRDWRSGLSEAVKVALIRDEDFFDFLEHHADRLADRDRPTMEQAVRRCAALHLSHIASGGDPFEQGSSRPLDFGHWSAHKLEQLSAHRLRHGEAVAIGIALDCTYSYLAGFLPESDWRRAVGLLQALGLPVHAPELNRRRGDPPAPPCVLDGLDEFREHLGGRLTLTLLSAVGEAIDVGEIDLRRMEESIEILEEIQQVSAPVMEEDHG